MTTDAQVALALRVNKVRDALVALYTGHAGRGAELYGEGIHALLALEADFKSLEEQLNAIRGLVATDERSTVVAKERIREVLGD